MGTMSKAFVAVAVLLSPPIVVHAQVDQPTLARGLMGGRSEDMWAAALAAEQLRPQDIAPGLRTALIAALEREGIAKRRARGWRARLDDSQLVGRLAMIVSELGDPRGIPGIVGALGVSPRATLRLASFGDRAAAPVIEAVRTASETSVVYDGLQVLVEMALGREGPPLSTPTRDELRAVAGLYLDESESVTTLWCALELAAALGDQGLRQTMEAIAANASAVIERGFTDPYDIEMSQKLARELLAGMPPRRLRG